MPDLENHIVRRRLYPLIGKRIADVLTAGLLLVALSIPLGVLALIVRIDLGSPILFRQTRMGKDEKSFEILKLRTMTIDRDAFGELLPPKKRATTLGRFLRRTSLDELPQLWNVLRGEMSIVGPRPLHPYYLPYYTTRERFRHAVRPGITGLAQIRGRKLLDWDSRLTLDVEYVKQCSLRLDLIILFSTACVLLQRRGDEADPRVETPTLVAFRGNQFVQPEDHVMLDGRQDQ